MLRPSKAPDAHINKMHQHERFLSSHRYSQGCPPGNTLYLLGRVAIEVIPCCPTGIFNPPVGVGHRAGRIKVCP